MKTCAHPGCNDEHRGHGLCNKHLHRLRTYGDPSFVKYKRHGKDKKTYNVWHAMMERCGNPDDLHFSSYGGRGITVCARWQEFENFYADMGQQPPGLTVERKDNDLGYSPDNCVWATRKAQQRNRRCNKLTIEGARTIRARYAAGDLQKDIAADFNINPGTVSQVVSGRIWAEDTADRALPPEDIP